MYVDSHAHLTSPDFNADREEVLHRARDAGVEVIVNPGTDLDDSRKAVELADRHPGVYACVGFHPHEARQADDAALQEIEDLSQHPRVVAIGEIGLDFHYDLSPRDTQERVFRDQLALAQRRNLPVVIHTREATERTVTLVDEALVRDPRWRAVSDPESRIAGLRGVFHCFPGDVAQARALNDKGFFVSLPGIVTFKKPGHAVDIAINISPEHLLLETDSPYLAPVPHRGRRNEPAFLPLIAERIAVLQGLAAADIGRATSFNIHRLFGIGTAEAPRSTYLLRNSLYVNLTLRCNADCVFCDRKGAAVIKGNNLRIDAEPSVEEVIREIADPLRYDEIVFCGYGEPTIRLEAVKQIARWVKQRGGKTRLNTDGHGNIINKRNIVSELVGLIDALSISMNTADPEQYGRLMRLNEKIFFPAMTDFARQAARLIPTVTMTIVDLPEVDHERARRLATELGARFSVRPYF